MAFTPEMEIRILGALTAVEEIPAAVRDLKGSVEQQRIDLARYREETAGLRRECNLTHKNVDGRFEHDGSEIKRLTAELASLKREQRASVTNELGELKEGRRYWTRYLVIAVIGLLTGGGGVLAWVQAAKATHSPVPAAASSHALP